jgi:formate dehydrogenase beta subunit
MELGEPDASGRRRPIPVTGSEFIIKTNMLITATGEQPDLSFLTDKKSVRVTKQGTIEADQYSGQTSQATIFAGGDCVTGPATIIEAIAAGNKAAKSIDQYLRTGSFSHTGEQLMDKVSEKLDLTQQRDGVFIAQNQRRIPEQLPVTSRTQSFAEVEKVFTAESAISEAQRCLRCYRVLLLATSDK